MRAHDHRLDADPRVNKVIRRKKTLSCVFCPPNRGENRARVPKHGARPPRSKNRPRDG